MAAIKDLQEILNQLKPKRNEGEYVFVKTQPDQIPPLQDVIMLFKEKEGTTLILEKTKAIALGLSFDVVVAWITIDVHTSLEAVGLTAKMAAVLTQKNISCNVVAAFHHDHIFVPKEKASQAMDALNSLRN